MTIYLIRHTSLKGVDGLCYGQLNVELSDSFEAEAERLKELLSMTRKGLVYSSPLSRCVILAEYLAMSPVIEDRRIMEYSFGDWEGKSWDDIGQPAIDKWAYSLIDGKVPGGESFRDFHQRVRDFFGEIWDGKEESVYIITHGGVIRSMISECLGISLENSLRIGIDYGSVSRISGDKENCRVDYVNRVALKKN